MPIVLAFIIAYIPAILKFLFTFLGVGLVSYGLLDFVITNVETLIFANYNNMATDVLAILYIANVDTAIKIILASYTAGIAVKTLLTGTKRFTMTA